MSVVTPENDQLNRYFQQEKRTMPVRAILALFFLTVSLGIFVVLSQSGIDPIALAMDKARLLQANLSSSLSIKLPRHALFLVANTAVCLFAVLIMRVSKR